MRSRKALWLLVIALFATALVTVGCGSSDDKSSNDTTAAQTTAATPPATTDASTPPATTDSAPPTDTGGGDASDPAIKAAVDACKQQIAAAPTLNDSTKADLDKICEEITSSDPAQIKKVAKDVCTKIVDDSNLPDGPAKDQAKQACDAVGG
jgi:hypothetical protein